MQSLSRRLFVSALFALLVTAGFAASPAEAAAAKSCSPSAVGSFRTEFTKPVLDRRAPEPTVSGVMRTTVRGNTNCTPASATYYLELYICNAPHQPGCHWLARASHTEDALPVSGKLKVQLDLPCRTGRNPYRLRADITHYQPGSNPPLTVTDTTTGPSATYTC